MLYIGILGNNLRPIQIHIFMEHYKTYLKIHIKIGLKKLNIQYITSNSKNNSPHMVLQLYGVFDRENKFSP